MDNLRDNHIQRAILNRKESDVLMQWPLAQRVTLGFSAKESLFKAVCSTSLHYVSFPDVEIVADDAVSSLLTLRLRVHLSAEFFSGRCFTAHYRFEGNKVITLIYY